MTNPLETLAAQNRPAREPAWRAKFLPAFRSVLALIGL